MAKAQKPAAGGDLGFEAELFKAADKLRGNMEPSDYKHVAVLSCLDGALRSRVMFGFAAVAGAVMSPAFDCGVDPLALMFVR